MSGAHPVVAPPRSGPTRPWWRRWLANALRWSIALSILAYVSTWVPFGDVVRALASAAWAPLVGAFAVAIVMQLVGAARIRRLVRVHGFDLSTAELFQINLATQFYSLFLPAGNLAGIAVRLYRISSRQGRYVAAGVSIVFERLVVTMGLCVVGIGCWLLAGPDVGWPILVLMAAALAALVALHGALFSSAWPSALSGLRQRLARSLPKKLEVVREAMRTARTLPLRTLAEVAVLALLGHGLGIVSYGLVASALDLDLSLVAIGWMRTLTMLASMLPFSVGGLGVREGVWVLLLAPIGIAAADALAFSLLIFASTVLAVAIVGGLIETKWLLPQASRE